MWGGVTRVTGSPVTWGGGEYLVLNGHELPDRDRVARLQTSWTYSFPPSPKKFLHSFLGCLKNSRSRFKSFYFFRKKLRSFDGFDQMSAYWSMFWFKPFRNFLRKIAIFWNFDHWLEILSMSAGRPISQGVCPPLYQIVVRRPAVPQARVRNSIPDPLLSKGDEKIRSVPQWMYACMDEWMCYCMFWIIIKQRELLSATKP